MPDALVEKVGDWPNTIARREFAGFDVAVFTAIG